MATIRQNADGSVGMINEAEGLEISRVGGPKTPVAATGFTHRNENTAKVILGTAGTAAFTNTMALWQPPNPAEDVIVTRVCVNITGTANGTFNCGTVFSNQLVGSNLLDTQALSAPGLLDNITDKGTNGKSRQYLTAGSFVAASPSITTSGLVGTMFIDYIKA